MTSFLLALALASPTLSIHVEGDGYLRLAREGRVVYATAAKISVSDGHLAAGDAAFLPAINVPSSATALDIDLQGEVFAVTGSNRALIGQLVLATFAKSSIVTQDGPFFMASDRPTLGNPGDGFNGVIRVDGAAKATSSDQTGKQEKPTSTAAAQHPNAQRPTPNASVSHLPSGSAEIAIHSESQIQGENITLGDIADIDAAAGFKAQLAATDMGRAPIVGVTRGLDTSFILAKLRTAGIKVDHITVTTPQGAHVVQASQKITSGDLLQAANQAVKDQLGIDMPLRALSDVQDTVAPLGKLELRPSNVIKGANGISLTIDIRVDDKHWTTRSLMLAPSQTGGVGVKAGQIVKVIVKLNGASLECTGRVQTSAWVGEQVSVRTDTGALQMGTVTAPNTVEVKL